MATTRPRLRAARVTLERLEGRALLNGSLARADLAPRLAMHPGTHPRAVETAHLAPRSDHGAISDHNPLRERVVEGLALKRFPNFYKLYKGPRLPGLNARVASAHLVPDVGFVFTGTMAGPIDQTAPTSFIFDINRGGAHAPGPYPQRAMVFFDSFITVATGPQGVTGTVTTLDHSGAVRSETALPAENVAINGPTVSVIVPPGLLPPTSTPQTRLKLTEYRFNLHVQHGTGSGPDAIASFVPEYSTAPFAIPRLGG